MDILVHNVCEIDSAHRYQYLIKKLTVLFSDLISSRKTEYGYTIDIFNVHVVFRCGPLERIIEYYPPEYYYSDDYKVSCYLLQESCKSIPRSKRLASLDMLYYLILQEGRKLQYSHNCHSLELRFKLLNIAQEHNFDLLFHKCIGYVDRYYEAIFKNNHNGKITKIDFYLIDYPDWNDVYFEDLEKRIIMDLVNREENEMTTNEFYDFCNLNTGIVKATNAITSAASSLKDCFSSDSPIVKNAANFYGVPEIKKVIFNDPATIVLWKDGTKTVVKAQDKEEFDKEKGLAMAISKKSLGNEGQYYGTFKKWLKEETR